MGDSEFLERARREPFQPIADSPTIKYYTNWSVFEKRLESPDSTAYPDPPEWLDDIEAGTLVLLADTVRIARGGRYVEDLGGRYDVTRDLNPQGRVELYHAARLTAATAIRVPAGVDAGSVAVASLAGDGYTGHHVLVELGPKARLEPVLVDLGSRYPESIKTLTLTARLAEASTLRLYSLSMHSNTAVYSRRIYRLGGSAGLEAGMLYEPGPATRVSEDAYLEGQASEASMTAAALTPQGSRGDILLNTLHKGRGSRSRITGRGASLEKGFLSLRGAAVVREEAEWSSTRVDVRVVTLGDHAWGNAVPMLEIHTGNVEEAYHSASITSLLEEELFYLASRGFSLKDAEALLIQSIAEAPGVLERLGLEPGLLT
jgi:hypothetical protein